MNSQFFRSDVFCPSLDMWLKFFCQYSIGPYILDFYCPAVKLAVELDGGQHNECEKREYDAARSEYLKAQGISVLRFNQRGGTPHKSPKNRK